MLKYSPKLSPQFWFPMAPYDYLWISMTPYSSIWLPMASYGSLLLPMTPYVSLRLPMAYYGSLRISTAPCEVVLYSLTLLESVWLNVWNFAVDSLPACSWLFLISVWFCLTQFNYSQTLFLLESIWPSLTLFDSAWHCLTYAAMHKICACFV